MTLTDPGPRNVSLFDHAHACLISRAPEDKTALSRHTASLWQQQKLNLTPGKTLPVQSPGRPPRPELVEARYLQRRRPSTMQGRACLLHALTHIEFNAINLAWDAIHRYRDMPRQYYDDWIRVAVEEAHHFCLLRDHLRSLGYDYGDFTAHNGLWDMAEKTAHDVLARMALVPRCLEARGLDASPAIRDRLSACGDEEAAAILDRILHDEIGHVAIGDHWYRYLCRLRSVEPEQTYRDLIARYMDGPVKGPFHTEARLQAGFSMRELQHLMSQQG